jgi:hypothetical protein
MTKQRTTELTQSAYNFCLKHRSGGARIIASFVLATYNGRTYKAEVDGVGNLDKEHFEMAMGIIHLRWYGLEPHLVVKDGSRKTHQLAKLFQPKAWYDVVNNDE